MSLMITAQPTAIRWGWLILAGLVVASLGLGTWLFSGMASPHRWPIHWLELSGDFQRVSDQQVRAAVAPLISTGFFNVDLNQVREACSALPWVASAVVSKQWPDSVRVHVTEHVPVARWRDEELINTAGVAFKVSGANELQGLPHLQGGSEQLAAVIEKWQAWRKELTITGLDIDRITLDQRGAWTLLLNNETTLRLGKQENTQRLQRFAAIWNRLTQAQTLPPLAVDMRYTNGLAVQWPQGVAAEINQDES